MRTWLVVGVLLCWSCAASFPPLDLKQLPGAKEHPHAKWVVLLDETQVDFGLGAGGVPEALETRRWRIRVLKAGTVPDVVAFTDRTFSKVESIRGRIVTADGKQTPLDTSKLADFPVFSSSVLFSDSRVSRVPVPPVPVGAVFESEVVQRRVDMRPFVVSESFGDFEPVEQARVVLTAPKGWTVQWKLMATDAQVLSPVESDEGARHRWVFERTKLPALETEASGPPPWALVPTLHARLYSWTEGSTPKETWKSPEELSRALAAEYAKQAAPSPEMEAVVKQVLAGVPDAPEAKARALYEYACRAIQYCAIEVGYGGWIPHASSAVQASRYGDCKDKATHLHALLKLAGVESSPTLIYAHQGTPRPFGLPSMASNFNHAILAVHLPGRTVYADPTHRAVPFGQLPPSDQDATVLQLTAAGAGLARTPESTPQENVERQRFTLTLGPEGDGRGAFVVEAQGARAQPFVSRWLEGTGTANRWLSERLFLKSAFVEGTARRATAGDFDGAARVEGEVLVRRLVASGGAGASVVRAVDVFDRWLRRYDTPRKGDLVTRYLDTQEAVLTLTLPASATAVRLPPDATLESPVGRYALTWRLEGGALEARRTLEWRKRVVPPQQVDAVNAFADAVLQAELEPVVLNLGGAR